MLTFLTQFVLLHFTSATKEGSENILIMLPQNRLSTPLLHLVLKWEIQLPRLQHIYNTAARVFTLTKHSLIALIYTRYIVLHVLDKAFLGNTEAMGQVFIDLTNLDIEEGYTGKFPLADLVRILSLVHILPVFMSQICNG